jgi:PAS domain S-box-containing protein
LHDAPPPTKEQFQSAVNAIPGLVWRTSPDGHVEFLNQRWLEYTGLALDEATGWGWQEAVHPEDLPRLLDYWKHVLQSGAPGEVEARLRRVDGEFRWFLFRAVPLYDAAGVLVRWYGQNTDIEDLKRAEASLEREKRLLEMIATGEPLGATLNALCRLVEEEFRGPLVSILLADARGEHLVHAAGPSLPPAYVERFARCPADAAFGPCGTAAIQREQVIVPDFATEARWPEYRDFARVQGFNACWSTPIMSSKRSVLGTFAVLSREAGLPLPAQIARIEKFTHLASIAIERARDIDALRQSEARYALAVDAAGDGHIDWIVATDEFYASPRFLEMCGLAADTTFRGRSDYLRRFPYHPDDRDRVIETIESCFASSTLRLEVEFRILRLGETRWLHLTGLCSRDGSGTLVRWNAAVTDVTERKRAEEALSLSEGRYGRAMEASEEGHWEWNMATDEMFLSPRIREMLGIAPDAHFASREEFFIRQPIHPDDRQHVKDARSTLLADNSRRYEIEYRILPRPGETRWVRSRGKVFHDEQGNTVRITGTLTDITNARIADEALRRSEERFSLAVAGSTDGIWDWDIVTGEMFFAERTQVLHGLVPGRTVRQRTEWRTMYTLHPDDAEGELRTIEDYVAGRAATYDGEWRVRHADGSYRWVRGRGLCVRDAAGRATRMVGAVSDIDSRKRAEAALRLSEQRYALVMQGSGEGHWDWNILTDEYYASPRMLELYGLAPDTVFTGRADFLSRFPFHPEDRPRWEEATAAHFAGRTARFDMELRMIPNGEVRWIHLTGLLSRDAEGRPTRWTGSVTDVTARRSAEEALRLSEHRYALAMDATGDGHWDWDMAADRFYASPLLLRMVGLPEDTQFPGRADWLACFPFHAEDRPKYDEAVTAHFAGHTARLEIDIRIMPRGELRWVHMTGRCSRDAAGKPVRWAGSITDVTARRRVDEELLARQDMLNLAQKAARAVAFEWRMGGEGENRWSPGLEAMYGLAPGSYDGTYESWKKLVHAEDWPTVRAAIKTAQQTGDVAAEYRVVHGDGSVHWLQAKGRMFFDAGGTVTRVVGFMLDVTDQREAEDELRRMERQLRQAQRLEAMGTLAGGIAHDFNNLLGAILGYGEMALRDAPEGSRLQRDVHSILIAGERGRALVDRILAFSRSSVGERVAVQVHDVVRETLDLVTSKLPAGIAIEQRFCATPAAVMGDATQIHQVLMNLLTNALQAMPAGGTLRLSLDCVHIDVPRDAFAGTLLDRDYVVLEVADTGSGIPAEIVERIFDPFFTTKDVGVGTGLGLSLVHGIVTGLGGAIDVSTAIDAGSRFTVYLPRSNDAHVTQRSAPRLAAKTPRGTGQRILVVDDEESLVQLSSEILEDLGYVVVGVTSSAAARAAFATDPRGFDAMITDESMPSESGSELIRKLRVTRPALPIVLISGYLGSALVQRAREAGADEVLKKPVSVRDLAASIDRVLHASANSEQPAPGGAVAMACSVPRQRVVVGEAAPRSAPARRRRASLRSR